MDKHSKHNKHTSNNVVTLLLTQIMGPLAHWPIGGFVTGDKELCGFGSRDSRDSRGSQGVFVAKVAMFESVRIPNGGRCVGILSVTRFTGKTPSLGF